MNLYRYTCGLDDKYGAAADEQDAYNRRAEVDPTFDFLPVTIEQVIIKGYDIILQPSENDEFEEMDKASLREWLDARKIEYAPQSGDKKLREICREWLAKNGA